MLRRMKANPDAEKDAKIRAEADPSVLQAAFELGRGEKISQEMNEEIKKLNLKLSSFSELITAESKARIHGGKPEDWLA